MIDIFAILDDFGRRRSVDPRRLSVIELNRSGRGPLVVALLAFAEGRAEPLAFLKAAADPRRASSLRLEFENLTRLGRAADSLRSSIPQPLYCERLGDWTVLAESAHAGRRMKDFPPDDYFASREFRLHFSQVASWLGQFGQALGRETVAAHGAGALGREIERYRSTHDVSLALSALLDETLRDLERREFPLLPCHGDFCSANVVVLGGPAIFVVDWEHRLDPTWPLVDFVHFVASTWCVRYRKGGDTLRENYRRLFFTAHGYSDLIRDSAAAYARRLGIPPDLLLPLSTVAWVAQANRKHDALAAGGDARVDWPLVMIENHACLNLEILAENRERYLLSQAG